MRDVVFNRMNSWLDDLAKRIDKMSDKNEITAGVEQELWNLVDYLEGKLKETKSDPNFHLSQFVFDATAPAHLRFVKEYGIVHCTGKWQEFMATAVILQNCVIGHHRINPYESRKSRISLRRMELDQKIGRCHMLDVYVTDIKEAVRLGQLHGLKHESFLQLFFGKGNLRPVYRHNRGDSCHDNLIAKPGTVLTAGYFLQ